MKENTRRRFGDRKDGKLIRNLDSMHFIVPLIFPNRCDNEAYISEQVDLERLNRYIAEKNSANPEFKYTLFHVIVTAMLKTIILRPKMNRFIANKNMYQRNEVTAAFVVKKIFSDDGAEALAILRGENEDTLESVHNKIFEQVSSGRSEKKDTTTNSMDIVTKLPRFIAKFVAWIAVKLDKHGWCPQAFIGSDPYYSSVLLSNLGSIKLQCGYHHLSNWGTTSIFCVIGEKKMAPVYDSQGNMEMHETVELGLTVDERLADGYYYSKTVQLLKKLLQNPELLEKPLGEQVDI